MTNQVPVRTKHLLYMAESCTKVEFRVYLTLYMLSSGRDSRWVSQDAIIQEMGQMGYGRQGLRDAFGWLGRHDCVERQLRGEAAYWRTREPTPRPNGFEERYAFSPSSG